MKKLIITAFLSIIAFNSYAQWSDKKNPQENLVIQSSQTRIEIKTPSECMKNISENGTISINCETQCKQTVDKQGKVLIQC